MQLNPAQVLNFIFNQSIDTNKFTQMFVLLSNQNRGNLSAQNIHCGFVIYFIFFIEIHKFRFHKNVKWFFSYQDPWFLTSLMEIVITFRCHQKRLCTWFRIWFAEYFQLPFQMNFSLNVFRYLMWSLFGFCFISQEHQFECRL